jgi:hypothetical protein
MDVVIHTVVMLGNSSVPVGTFIVFITRGNVMETETVLMAVMNSDVMK